jgi:hypothetical protein
LPEMSFLRCPHHCSFTSPRSFFKCHPVRESTLALKPTCSPLTLFFITSPLWQLSVIYLFLSCRNKYQIFIWFCDLRHNNGCNISNQLIFVEWVNKYYIQLIVYLLSF